MEFYSIWSDVQRASWPQLQSDLTCDTAIIGAGISGIATLYFLLTTTNLSVALFERHLTASGATGNSAGLPTIHIERSISELIDEYGTDLIHRVYTDMELAKDDLSEMHKKAGIPENLVQLPPLRIGFNSLPSFLEWLELELLYIQVGREPWSYWLAEELSVPEKFLEQIRFVSQEEILSALNTKDTDYIAFALITEPRTRMNGTLFCNRVLQYLAKAFPSRCFIYENTEISRIDLAEDEQILQHALGKVHTQDLILCTNAYKDFTIFDTRTEQPVTKLHEALISREGYLAAFPSPNSEPSVVVFRNEDIGYPDAPYWYLSTAPLATGAQEYVSCLGGPEYTFTSLEPSDSYATTSLELMGQFCEKNFHRSIAFSHFWHGTMGYTQTGLRWVGEDPDHSHLWYNLGCNGIGILPAIAGAKRIAKQMSGDVLEPSLYDPPASE